MRSVRAIIGLLLMLCASSMWAQRAAGISPDMPTRVADTTMLTVQSGSNYIRIVPSHLPAIITYLPDTAFGPIPTALVDGRMVQAQAVFADCAMGWQWEIGLADDAKTIEIQAHENASVLVEPYVCPTDKAFSEVAWDSYQWHGTTYTESGEYIKVLSNDRGCEWGETLQLTLHTTGYFTVDTTGCNKVEYEGQTYTKTGQYFDTIPNGEDRIIRIVNVQLGICPKDTMIYFCQGANWEHTEEQGRYLISYMPYTYEEPGDWCLDGVVLTREQDRTLVDFGRAEENLYAYYTNGLVPIKSISWMYRAVNAGTKPIDVSEGPQWIESGTVTVVVRFVCGQVYSSNFETDIDFVNAESMSGCKVLMNGQLFILRGGAKYSVLGTKIE